MIYFARVNTNGAIKIGHSVDPEVRVRNIRATLGLNLRLIATMPGSEEDENELHAKFASVVADNEWFFPVPELLRFIEANATPWPDTQCVVTREPLGSPDPKSTQLVSFTMPAEIHRWFGRYKKFKWPEKGIVHNRAVFFHVLEVAARAEGFCLPFPVIESRRPKTRGGEIVHRFRRDRQRRFQAQEETEKKISGNRTPDS